MRSFPAFSKLTVMREPIIDWIWPRPQSGRAGWRTKSPGWSSVLLYKSDEDISEHRMTPTRIAIAAALASALVAPAAAQAQGRMPVEKCFGVAKAGQNDCQTDTSSCAGTSKKDNQPDAWIAVPKGTCQKIVGGVVKG